VVIAPQEFKGTLTARQAARAMAAGVRRVFPAAERLVRPMADGGPGMLDALLSAHGGRRLRAVVTGPNATHVGAEWGILPDGTAVIETAQACGLMHVTGRQQPMTASTRGVGELLLLALDAGCPAILAGLGGSATSDAGTGMARALGTRLLDARGRELPEGGGSLRELRRLDLGPLDPRLEQTDIRVLCDVDNPLTGRRGAAVVFGPQKGASPEQVHILDEGFRRLAGLVAAERGGAFDRLPGAGAAGGLGFGFAAFCGARLERGAEEIGRATNLAASLEGAGLCVTGEGRLDAQTAGGKTVFHVATTAKATGVPVIAIAGRLGEGWDASGSLFDAVATIVDTPAASACEAARALRITTETALERWLAEDPPG
jgi:glycerate kinase